MHFLPFTRLPNHALPFNIFSSFKKYVYPTVSFIACFLLWEADYIITVLEILICYLEILVWDVQSKSPFIYSRVEPWELCTVMTCPMWKKIASICVVKLGARVYPQHLISNLVCLLPSMSDCYHKVMTQDYLYFHI